MNKYIKKLKSRIPAVLLLLGCFAVIAVSADYSELSVRASGGRVTEKKTIILDAGHGGYALSGVAV
jgi:N-acetylmuramoyl-L-alanine amidase